MGSGGALTAGGWAAVLGAVASGGSPVEGFVFPAVSPAEVLPAVLPAAAFPEVFPTVLDVLLRVLPAGLGDVFGGLCAEFRVGARSDSALSTLEPAALVPAEGPGSTSSCVRAGGITASVVSEGPPLGVCHHKV